MYGNTNRRGEPYISKHNTKKRIEGNRTIYTLYWTDIVEFTPLEIVIRPGSYFSNTTKRRINQILNFYNLGYQVKSVQGHWTVSRVKDNVVLYQILFEDTWLRIPRIYDEPYQV